MNIVTHIYAQKMISKKVNLKSFIGILMAKVKKVGILEKDSCIVLTKIIFNYKELEVV